MYPNVRTFIDEYTYGIVACQGRRAHNHSNGKNYALEIAGRTGTLWDLQKWSNSKLKVISAKANLLGNQRVISVSTAAWHTHTVA